MFDRYKVKITLNREMLGTNPLDPNILDKHVIERQRKLIADKSSTNTTINKYLDQLQITDETKETEIQALMDKLENMLGYSLNESQRKLILKGELEKLKETFSELELKATTVFLWDKSKNLPCIKDHMIYGFLKASGEAWSRTHETREKGKVLHSASYTQSIINQHVRCEELLITASNDVKKDENGKPLYNCRSLRAQTPQGPRITLTKSEALPEGTEFNFTLKVMKGSPLKEETLRKLFDYGQMTGLGQWRNAGNGTFSYTLDKV